MTPTKTQPGCSASAYEASKAQVFEFQVLLDAILGAFDTQTGLFDPRERGLCGGHKALVDPNDPNLQCLSHTPDLTHILRVEETCGQMSVTRSHVRDRTKDTYNRRMIQGAAMTCTSPLQQVRLVLELKTNLGRKEKHLQERSPVVFC